MVHPMSESDVAVIIGVMKGGSTTLFDRLVSLPGVARPRQKEPGFFTDDAVWRKGESWYRENLAATGLLGLDATVDCTDPDRAAVAAVRIQRTLGTPRLLVVLRDPVERLRSHYLHEVQRGRERRPFTEALAEAGNQYVRRSRYDRCLSPYLDGPLAPQLLAVRTEALDEEATWSRILRHLGLDDAPLDPSRRNVSSAKVPMTGLGAKMWKSGALQHADRLPAPLRRLGRSLAFHDSARSVALRKSASAPIQPDLAADLRAGNTHAWERLTACGATDL